MVGLHLVWAPICRVCQTGTMKGLKTKARDLFCQYSLCQTGSCIKLRVDLKNLDSGFWIELWCWESRRNQRVLETLFKDRTPCRPCVSCGGLKYSGFLKRKGKPDFQIMLPVSIGEPKKSQDRSRCCISVYVRDRLLKTTGCYQNLLELTTSK